MSSGRRSERERRDDPVHHAAVNELALVEEYLDDADRSGGRWGVNPVEESSRPGTGTGGSDSQQCHVRVKRLSVELGVHEFELPPDRFGERMQVIAPLGDTGPDDARPHRVGESSDPPEAKIERGSARRGPGESALDHGNGIGRNVAEERDGQVSGVITRGA